MQSTISASSAGNKKQSSSGKTSQVSSQATTTPLVAFWQDLPEKAVNLSHQGESGRTLVVCMDPKGQSLGSSKTPNISEWPNDASVCSLSQVLEKDSIPAKYFLSPKACAGILRRAENRKRQLPPLLREALERVAQMTIRPKQDTSSLSVVETQGETSMLPPA